jgi:Xaa-Pro aminopeptidase
MVNGALHPAYPSIVGGGGNACILHYIENNQKLRDGDLVLVDAGGEYNNYASDITRTFPVNGKFTRDQQALYEIVLAAQLDAIDATVAGDHWNRPHEAALKVLVQGLVDLGILEGGVDELIEETAYRPWFMHRTGHWIGLDVHDVGDYKIHDQWRVLEPGMVTTVEPGLYFHPKDERVPKRWRGMGIRIEDDVAVTKEGPDILSQDAPKQVDEIERLMAEQRRQRA